MSNIRKNEAALALFHTCRKNVRDQLSLIADEFLPQNQTRNYVNPIIRLRKWHLEDPTHREAVAALDSIGRRLTVDFANDAWARMPKFYESDELNAVETPQLKEMRNFLDYIGFNKPATQAMILAATHGWCLCKFWFEKDYLQYELWSEGEILPTAIVRDNRNRPILYNVYLSPRLPCDRSPSSIKVLRRTYKIGDPGVILLTRGDPITSVGFGYSRLEGPWDAIQKLNLESHGNNFRSRLFATVVYPPNWTPEQLKEFMTSLSKTDETNALCMRGTVDNDGKPVSGLPNAMWNTPGQGASNKSEGAFSGMSPEWARLCSVTGYSIRHFVGNPGGAEAAASVDSDQDLERDIQEFNMYRDLVYDFIAFCQSIGLAPELPNFVMKGHWEWERDEKRLAEAQSAQKDMELKQQYVQAKESRPVGAPKLNEVEVEDLTPVFRMNCTKAEFETALNMSHPKMPVYSSNVDSVAYADNPGQMHDKLYLSFKGSPNVYYYDGVPESMWEDFISSPSKGGWVWDNLRGKTSGKRGGVAKGVGVGSGHKWQPYGVVRGMPDVWETETAPESEVGQEFEKPEQTRLTGGGGITEHDVDQPGQESTAPPKEESIPSKDREFYASSPLWKKGLKESFKEAGLNPPALTKRNAAQGISLPVDDIPADAFKHDIDLQFPSRSAAAREMHVAKNTIYKRMETPETVMRENMSATGWGFHAENPYVYVVDGRVRAEYVCPDAAKALVGKKVPLGVYHNRENEADPAIPEWQRIGYYEVIGWDEEHKHDIAKLNYDLDWEQKVSQIFQKLNEPDWVTPMLKQNKHPDISTAYNCAVHYDYHKNKWIQNQFDFKSVSLVPEGNCSQPYCETTIDAEEQKQNASTEYTCASCGRKFRQIKGIPTCPQCRSTKVYSKFEWKEGSFE